MPTIAGSLVGDAYLKTRPFDGHNGTAEAEDHRVEKTHTGSRRGRSLGAHVK